MDKSGNGTLDKKDVVEALKAQLPINVRRLEEEFDIFWKEWDNDNTGDLSMANLTYLIEYIRQLKDEHRLRGNEKQQHEAQPPPQPTLNS